MTITEIAKIGKGFRFKVFVDGDFVGELEAEILAKYKLKTGDEIDKDYLDKILHDNADLACFDRALSVLEKSAKTKKMMADFLKEKKYPVDSIEKAIAKLQDYGYINDGAFAENYIKSYSQQKGKFRLKQELLAKGIDDDIIQEKLSDLSEEEMEESCRQLAQKFAKSRRQDEKLSEKLFRHLLGKGYSYSMVAKVVGEVKNDRD